MLDPFQWSLTTAVIVGTGSALLLTAGMALAMRGKPRSSPVANANKYPKDKIILFSFPRPDVNVAQTPDYSSFGAKLECYLKFADLPYDRESILNPSKGTVWSMVAPECGDHVPLQPALNPRLVGPTGKVPYILYNGQVYGDSDLIIRFIRNELGRDLDKDLTAEQRAIGTAFQSLVEDHLYFIGLWFRWVVDKNFKDFFDTVFAPRMPAFVAPIVKYSIRKNMIRSLNGQGIGRHQPEIVMEFYKRDIDQLSVFLGNKIYLLGTTNPTSYDACLFGLMVNVYAVGKLTPELREYALQKENLVLYVNRIMKTYFPERCPA